MGMFGPSVGYSAHERLAMLGGISHNVNILVKPRAARVPEICEG